jgi:cysteine synthase A
MFRTAVRQFACTARRAAGTVETLTIPEIEAAYSHGIEISKAQRIASRGLIDGLSFFKAVRYLG